MRTVGMVSGGALPAARRGQKEERLVTAWDWFATYSGIAGVDPRDARAAAAGLPPIDSFNQWPLISGALPPNATVRTEIAIGDTTATSPNGDGDAIVGGLIQGGYKLLLGAPNKGLRITQDCLTGPSWPNKTSTLKPEAHSRRCDRTNANGCLFDVMGDPLETHSLADADDANRARFAAMLARIDVLQKGVYSPKRTGGSGEACAAAEKKYGGYWGPFVGV